MKKVTLEAHKSVAMVRLTNGVTNPICPDMAQNLFDAVKDVKTGFKSLVLCGGSKFFSIGFDLPLLLKLKRPDLEAFFDLFNRAVLDLFTLPVPTACAIDGHATAGGAILASACDYRYVAEGRKLIGVNEIKIGVPVPYLADLILRQLIDERSATLMLYKGDFLEPIEAQKIGLIDRVSPSEELESFAKDEMLKMSEVPQPAFSQIKSNRVEEICSRYEKNFKLKNKYMIDCWYQPAVQKLLFNAAEKF